MNPKVNTDSAVRDSLTVPTVYLQDPDVTLYHGDAVEALRLLPDESVHMCVTSPPFYGLRDYGTGRWEGGNPDCDHKRIEAKQRAELTRQARPVERHDDGGGNSSWGERDGATYGQTCGKCGARRVDQQIGLEETPEQWCQSLVDVFREVRRVLRDDGTLWLEVGDSYNSPSSGRTRDDYDTTPLNPDDAVRKYQAGDGFRKDKALKPKDLIGAPWRLAFALQADGWYLRSDIVWSRPNPMPESVTDRPTKSHSYVFLLAKQPRYFFDQEAVREPDSEIDRRFGGDGSHYGNGVRYHDGEEAREAGAQRGAWFGQAPGGRNVRSVWNIATQPYPEAHFATFPEELARRCILAGTSERGCCPECGAPWRREVERPGIAPGDSGTAPGSNSQNFGNKGDPRMGGGQARQAWLDAHPLVTTGWRPSCACTEGLAPEEYADYGFSPVTCVVLDPFVGSGTVPYVARLHGRHAIGIDLNATYLELAAERLQQQSLFAGMSATEGAR